jgi:hypothetical protein
VPVLALLLDLLTVFFPVAGGALLWLNLRPRRPHIATKEDDPARLALTEHPPAKPPVRGRSRRPKPTIAPLAQRAVASVRGTCSSLRSYRSGGGKGFCLWFGSCRFSPLVCSASFRMQHSQISRSRRRQERRRPSSVLYKGFPAHGIALPGSFAIGTTGSELRT